MKTLAPLLLQIFDQLSRVFQPNRYPQRARFYFRASRMFFTPALVRTVNRCESQRLSVRQSRRLQK